METVENRLVWLRGVCLVFWVTLCVCSEPCEAACLPPQVSRGCVWEQGQPDDCRPPNCAVPEAPLLCSCKWILTLMCQFVSWSLVTTPASAPDTPLSCYLVPLSQFAFLRNPALTPTHNPCSRCFPVVAHRASFILGIYCMILHSTRITAMKQQWHNLVVGCTSLGSQHRKAESSVWNSSSTLSVSHSEAPLQVISVLSLLNVIFVVFFSLLHSVIEQ